MKTIPLKTLLGQITPLLWKCGSLKECETHEIQCVNGGALIATTHYGQIGKDEDMSAPDATYIRHACNHFPELVEVAREFQTCVLRDWHVPQELCDRMAKILASAETVQIED